MKTKTLLISTCLLASLGAQAQVNISVETQKRVHAISPTLYGIFYEDINHAADGGLYAELVRNRSFEDNDSKADSWGSYAQPGAKVSAYLVKDGLLNAAQHQALKVTFTASAQAKAGICNEGYWGINAVKGRTYKLSFWAKGKLKGHLYALLADAKGQKVYAQAKLDKKVKGKWQKMEATLTANADDAKARLYLLADGNGTVCFDVVSLMPPTFKGHTNGLRPDLAGMLNDLHPKFLRFPGGCFVEGQESPDNAFHWEKAIGPIETRPGHKNVNWGYRTSDGLGFDEYLQLAEDLGAKPLFVVNVGLWHGGKTPVDSLQPWIDECLNALEYANGPVTSKYGALRAKNGHPKPYNIEFLEIGNENNQPDPTQQSDRYYERFKLFKDAVLARYPQMHLIGNVAAWGTDDPKWESTESVELVDEHYYRNPSWFANNFRKYDSYDRKGPKVYVGEYAVTQGFGNHGSLNAALGEAVYMMGLENNSDIVRMASYAPIFANVNDLRWRPDMIQFNSQKAFGTPSYYVQKVMADNVGTAVLASTATNTVIPEPADKPLKPATCQVGIGTWGTQATFDSKVLNTVNVENVTEFNADSLTRGSWNKKDGLYHQTSDEDGAMLLDGQKFTANEYTYSVRARKDKGPEGFLVIFNYVDPQNYCWLNIGGWGNSQNAIEQVIDGSKTALVMSEGHVEEGRWYDVAVHVKGDSIYASLDGKQLFATKLKPNSFKGIFSSASLDEKTGEVVVKVVNAYATSTTANIDLKGMKPSQATIIRLSSANGSDENSLKEPNKIVPKTTLLKTNGNPLKVSLPAHSLNIIRVK